MADKLAGYTGGLYVLKSRAKDAWQAFQEAVPKEPFNSFQSQAAQKISVLKEKAINSLNKGNQGDYSHVYRRKKRSELVRVSAAVMGIEFAYAAETAFVSPTLLGIGVQHRHMTLIWCLSPIVGFFLTPILGSISDRCKSRLGRRRPFIILLSLGIILGLILVPNGKDIGRMLGDIYPEENNQTQYQNSSTFNVSDYSSNWTIGEESPLSEADIINKDTDTSTHPWSIFFTVLGTVLLDFDADACQSPSRAYLLDVCVPEDHALGLSTFTIMAGLGGSLGYAMGGINWDQTFIGVLLGGHVRAVFSLITIIFFVCVMVTLYSFSEIPLDVVADATNIEMVKERRVLNGQKYGKFTEEEQPSYGTINETSSSAPVTERTAHSESGIANTAFDDSYQNDEATNHPEKSQFEIHEEPELARATLKEYLMSIVFMPKSLRILCLTNLFCWMSLVCYSLYFTDFVGEAVFGGDPKAHPDSPERQTYEEGVRFGCWGMAMYSLSCSIYSFIIEKLVKRYRAKPVYMGSQLVYTVGMILMAVTRHKAGVIIFSWAAGVMYSTLFTMPYLLVAHYHASQVFSETKSGERQSTSQVRGLGTDVAIVSSMVFLAQFILSSSMGSIIASAGTTTAVVVAASVLSFCGCISASQVMYLDL